MTALYKAKFADKQSTHLVSGYIGNIGDVLNIPMIINYLCLLYYFVGEEFENHGKYIQLSSSNKHSLIKDTARYKSSYGGVPWNTVYGAFKIDPKQYRNCVIIWIIKYKYIHNAGISIGISGSNSMYLDSYRFKRCNDNSIYYGWDMMDALRMSLPFDKTNIYSSRYSDISLNKNNEYVTVKMEFDIKNKHLRFYQNNQYLDICWDNIDLSYYYYLTISFGHKCPPIKLIKFDITKSNDQYKALKPIITHPKQPEIYETIGSIFDL